MCSSKYATPMSGAILTPVFLHKKNITSTTLRYAATLLVCWLCYATAGTSYLRQQHLAAQELAQVTITGFPPTLSSPYLSDLQRSYEQREFITHFIYSSVNRQPRSFQFHLTLEKDGERLLEMTSDPIAFEPGVYTYQTFEDEPAIVFPLSYAEWVEQLSSSISDTGILDEGSYLLRIEPEPTDPNALVPTVPGIALFSVRYVDPPLLLSPFNGSALGSQFPTFSWTPITGAAAGTMYEYELLITEVFPNQAPYQALQSNRPIVQRVLVEQTSFVYTLNELPLEASKQYAWHVEARDIATGSPVLLNGETEFFTFFVESEGLGSMLTSWNYPINSPFLTYTFDDQTMLNADDSEFYLDDRLPVDLLGLSSSALFDNVLIDTESQRIIEGSVTLTDPIALEIEINPLIDVFSAYNVVAPGSSLDLTDGILLNLGNDVVIDAAGIRPRGTHAAQIAYSGQENSEWTATFSDDFVISVSPFTISRGRIDFASEGVAKGYADPSGFYLTEQGDPVVAQLPDRLFLPDRALGYVPLKDANQAFVELERVGNNQILVHTRPNATAQLHLTGLQSPQDAQAPQFSATLNGVRIDGSTGEMVAGTLTAHTADSSLNYTLDPLGIPIAPTSFMVTADSLEVSTTIDGFLTVLGQPVRTDSPVTLHIGSDQVVRGVIDQNSLDAVVWLDQAQQRSALRLNKAQGFLHSPLSSDEPSSIEIALEGTFNILEDEQQAASATVAMLFEGDGHFVITDVAPLQESMTSSPINVFGYPFFVEAIDALELMYTPDLGVEYKAHLSTTLHVEAGDDLLYLPLAGTELNEQGFFIPSQEIHAGIPRFTPSSFSAQEHHFELLAARIPFAAEQDADQTGTAPPDFTPTFDFEVRLAAVNQPSLALDELPLTLHNARILHGNVSGSIYPYRILRNAPVLSYDAGQFNITHVTGSFSAETDQPSYEIELTGSFELNGLQRDEPAGCAPPVLSLKWTSESALLTGSSTPFTACQPFSAGSFDVTLDTPRLHIQQRTHETDVLVEGPLTSIVSHQARLDDAPSPGASASGLMTLNLNTDTPVEADIQVDSLEWLFPATSPLYRIRIKDAALNERGFVLPGRTSFTAFSLTDSTSYALQTRDDFHLGWNPAQTNSGYADLVTRNQDATSIEGFFDEQGYHSDALHAAGTMPSSINLPGGHEMYIALTTSDSTHIESGRGDNTYTFQTDEETLVSIHIPVPGQSDPIRLPVSSDITLDASFTYVEGSLTGDYSDAPLDLTPWGYPLHLTAASFGDASPQDHLIFEGFLHTPGFLHSDRDEDRVRIMVSGSVGPQGFSAMIQEEATFEHLHEALTLTIEDLDLSHYAIEQGRLSIAGEIKHPLFAEGDTPYGLRYMARVDPSTMHWDIHLNNRVLASGIPMGKSVFYLDEGESYQVESSPAFRLELNGRLAYPHHLGEDFYLGATLEISPAGINIWSNDALATPRSLFGGLLTADIEDVEFLYDDEEDAVLAILDGTVVPGFLQQQRRRSILPFSGLQVSTHGVPALTEQFANDTTSAGQERRTMNLLANTASMVVLDDLLVIDKLQVSSDAKGLQARLSGTLSLPSQSPNRSSFRQTEQSVALPFFVEIDSRGSIIAEQTYWSHAMVDSLWHEQHGSQKPGTQFSYSAAYLDFPVHRTSVPAIHATARLIVDRDQDAFFSSIPDSFTTRSWQPSQALRLGHASNPRSRPGIIFSENRPSHFFLTDTPSEDQPFLTIDGDLTRMYVTSLTLPNPRRLEVSMNGRAALALDGFSGQFPIQGLTLNSEGLSNLGTSAGPAVFSFNNLASMEVGCFDYTENKLISAHSRSLTIDPRRGTSNSSYYPEAQLRFGTTCGPEMAITVSDRWLAGTYKDFNFTYDPQAGATTQITGAQLQLGDLATLNQSTFTYVADTSTSYFDVEGNTSFRGTSMGSSGALRLQDGQPSINLLFNPSRTTQEIIPSYVTAKAVGGGFFYRPAASDLELISLTLNERSNNSFVSNHPHRDPLTSMPGTDGMHVLLPADVAIQSNASQPDFEGVGLLHASEQLSHIDIDGSFRVLAEETPAELFLVEHKDSNDASLSAGTTRLEGIADISLDYSSVVGGLARTNFQLSAEAEGDHAWYAYGQSQFVVTDLFNLPGTFLLTPEGLLLDLQDRVSLGANRMHLLNDLSVTLWQEASSPSMHGYAKFEAGFDLVPGFFLGNTMMYGSLIEGEESYSLYAANNLFTDVPFVFSGPVDPWVSFQSGSMSGGDARNTAFRRMVLDAREASRNVVPTSAAIRDALNNALDTQQRLASATVPTKNLGFFAQPDSLLADLGTQFVDLESQPLEESTLPAIFETVKETLFDDPSNPDYGYAASLAPNTPTAISALDKMRTDVDLSRQNANRDLYSFQVLTARPLTWISDIVELAPELSDQPIQSITHPLETNATYPGFVVNNATARLQEASIQAFKQNNETSESQFLRAITALELNLVNLKTTRSSEQAFAFNRANASIERYYARLLADDWEMHTWAGEKANWLADQKSSIENGIATYLRQVDAQPEPMSFMREHVLQRQALLDALGQTISWERDDLPEDTRYADYIDTLEEQELRNEFERSMQYLWYDLPLAALSYASDTLSTLLEERVQLFNADRDSLARSADRLSRALGPFYDMQTAFTTTLYGMAEEYRSWRSSIKGLDPSAVDYSFKFAPYRGNYRLLAVDLLPPTIDEIRIFTDEDDFSSAARIEWDAEHAVEVSEVSLSIAEDTMSTTYFTSLGTDSQYLLHTVKPDNATTERNFSVTLKARGVGGIPVVKKGSFTLSVDPATSSETPEDGLSLTPFDATPPPSPQIAALSYSLYTSDTPNTLSFGIGALRDTDSGIDRIDYKIVNKKGSETIQDWTVLPMSTNYFTGRTVETSIPAQEEDITIQVTVRVTNGAGLEAETTEELRLNLDDSAPIASIRRIDYNNAFNLDHPNTLAIEFGEIRDSESGIDRIEFVILQDAQENLATATWSELMPLQGRPVQAGNQTTYLSLEDQLLPDTERTLLVYIRCTNGAGLQTVLNQSVLYQGNDRTPPTPPTVQLEHTGFYDDRTPNQLRIIVSGSEDSESGIDGVSYRIIDGLTGNTIVDWSNFVALNPGKSTHSLNAVERTVPLPAFRSSRSIIVEAISTNKAGLSSSKTVRFLPINLDVTPPTIEHVHVSSLTPNTSVHTDSFLLDVGRIEDLESSLAAIEYRVVDPQNQQALVPWQQLAEVTDQKQSFPGATHLISGSHPSGSANPVLQLRATNQEGLVSTKETPIQVALDTSPPTTPLLSLHYETGERGDSASLHIDIGEAKDLQSFIGTVRYRVRDTRVQDGQHGTWKRLAQRHPFDQFDGASIHEFVRALNARGQLVVDVEVVNGAGLNTQVSSALDLAGIAEGHDTHAPVFESYYYPPAHPIRANEIEVSLLPAGFHSSRLDSVRYRVRITNEDGELVLSADSSTVVTDWAVYALSTASASKRHDMHIALPTFELPARATIELEVYGPGEAFSELKEELPLTVLEDATPPTEPLVDAHYYGYYHPEQPNQADIVVQQTSDKESRVAALAYRIVEEGRRTRTLLDWQDLEVPTDNGTFNFLPFSIELPELTESTTLAVEVRSTNGVGLTSTGKTSILAVLDTSEPEITDPSVEITQRTTVGSTFQPAIRVHPGVITDEESPVTLVEYRVIHSSDSLEVLYDWTALDVPAGSIVRHPGLTLALPETIDPLSVAVEWRATNLADLVSTISQRISSTNDDSPPQIQPIEVTYTTNAFGRSQLFIGTTTFRDPESNIHAVDYRIVDAESDANVIQGWKPLPVLEDIRISIDPINIPRAELAFDEAKRVAVEFRARNGAGSTSVRREVVDIPGDETPPVRPIFQVEYRNTYAPRYPNTLEIQIGESIDEQSDVTEARYRMLNLSTGDTLKAWTELPVSSDGIFAGKVLFEELPFIENNTELHLELEFKNSAGLIRSLSETVTIQIERDSSPPVVTMSLFSFAGELVVVVDSLSDITSGIQKVEYRVVDNVDQTALKDWTELFEIQHPQKSYPQQAFNIGSLDVQRPVKVEIRTTNGAGLQTVVSKTILLSQDEGTP